MAHAFREIAQRAAMALPLALALALPFGFAGRAGAECRNSSRRQRQSPPRAAGPETIVVSGGCFWGVQGVFQHVKGVEFGGLRLRRRRSRYGAI